MQRLTHLRIPKFIAIVLACFGSSNLQAKDVLQSRIDPLVQPYLDNEVAMGLTIGVLQKGNSTVLGYGRYSKKDPRKPQGDTIYEIGSISKVFTGLLLADAVTQGRVKLDQVAGELLPKGVKMPANGSNLISLKNLSTHVSGLPRLPDNFKITNPNNPYADYTTKQLIQFLNRYQPARAPGAKSEYSNLGAGLLGNLLAFQRSSTYEKILLDRLAKPLKMTDTTITLDEKQKNRLAPPHTGDGQLTSNWDIPALAGAGAICSTVNDMLLLAKASLDPPENELGQAIELAWKVHQKPLAAGDFAMGLGWHVARDGSTRWHNGQTGGYHSMMLVSRDIDTAVVLLTNTATGEVDTLAQDIIRALAGVKVEPRIFEKTVDVPPEVMKCYVGKYELVPGAIFSVTIKEDKLMVGLTGQPSLQIYARSETEWFYKVVKASITFQLDDNDKCQSLELFQNGVRQTAKRVE